jgi:hypothetical protein
MCIDTKKIISLALLFLFMIISYGCSSQIDKHKFREIKSAVTAIDKAVGDKTLSYEEFGTLLQKLTDGITKTKAAVNTEGEKELLNSYEELLKTYQDGYTLWEYKIGSFQYVWIPKGRIYVDAKVRTIVEKYHFPTESHVVELTSHHWESISVESIQFVWDRAHEQVKKINPPFFF